MLIALPTGLTANVEPASYLAFLNHHCMECHDADVQKGGLDMEALSLSEPRDLEQWIKILERAERGEMPPKLADAPPRDELQAFVANLEPLLFSAVSNGSRTELRRLNRDQFLHSLDALLGPTAIPQLSKEELPVGVFDTEDRVLRASGAQMAEYFQAISAATEQSVQRILTGTKPKEWRLSPLDLLRSERDLTGFAVAKDGADLVVFLKGRSGINTVMTHRWSAPSAGWYRVRLQAAAYQSDHPQPIKLEVGMVGEYLTMRHVAFRDAPIGEPAWLEYEARLNPGEGLRFERADSEPEIWRHKLVDLKTEKAAGVRYRALEISGPYTQAQGYAEPVLDRLIKKHPTEAMPLLMSFAKAAYRRDDVDDLLE